MTKKSTQLPEGRMLSQEMRCKKPKQLPSVVFSQREQIFVAAVTQKPTRGQVLEGVISVHCAFIFFI